MTLINGSKHWYCPNCTSTTVTLQAMVRPLLHPCRGLHGIIAPMVAVGTKAKVTAVEREDYIGDEQAHRVMSVVTERDDGQDVAIFAPASVGRMDANDPRIR
jgi:hypothetical protein